MTWLLRVPRGSEKPGLRRSLLAAIVVASLIHRVTAGVATASPVGLFADDFESGGLAAWSSVQTGPGGSATVQSQTVRSGAYAARFSALSRRSSFAYARASLAAAATDVRAVAAVRLASVDSKDVPLLQLLDAASVPLVSVLRAGGSNTTLLVRHSGIVATSSGALSIGTWRLLEIRSLIAGAASSVELLVDGTSVYTSSTANLGVAGASIIQIGSDVKSTGFSAAVDDVVVTGSDQPPPDVTAPNTTIDSGPSGVVSNSNATFSFSSSEAGSTFACSLDASAYSPCSDPTSYAGLADGTHTFAVRATDAASNADPTPASRTWTITSASGDPILVGAGDIAECNNPGGEATATLLDSIGGTVFTAGDNVYPTGSSTQFSDCYGPSWGRHKTRTRPATGNHEYDTANASGYFGYFGTAAGDPTKGYYSYDLGTWHVIVLNSNCAAIGGCGAGSPQETWLRADLAANPTACTAAYFHHPRFSSGSHGSNTAVQPFWQALYDAGADVVISGHDHMYERFALQDPQGNADPTFGIRQFTVGTGGKSLYSLGTTRANSEVIDNATYGVLRLDLHPGTYDWQFVPVAGGTFADTGTGNCHDAPVQPPPDPVLFSDGFESGGFTAWTSVQTGGDGAASVQSSIVHAGSNAARLSSTSATGSFAYARTSSSAPRAEVTATGWFRVEAEGAAGGNVPLLRLFDAAGTRLVTAYRQNLSSSQVWVQHSGSYNSTSGTLPLRVWGKVAVRVVANGTDASTVEVRLNDAVIYTTSSASIPATGVLTVQIGNDVKGQIFTLIADDIEVG